MTATRTRPVLADATVASAADWFSANYPPPVGASPFDRYVGGDINLFRAGRAARILPVYYRSATAGPVEEAVRDLMSDLAHLAVAVGEDPDRLWQSARDVFIDETNRPHL